MLLTNTVKTTNTLFQQIRVKRQIEHHHFAGKLEVAALGADFRTEQYLGTVLFRGKVGGGAVTFDNRQAFVEYRGTNGFTLA